MTRDIGKFGKHIDINSRKGSIIVDAAISIPIFVLSMCFLVSIIKSIGREESAMAKMLETSKATSMACASLDLCIADELFLYDEGHVLVYRPFIGESRTEDNEMVYIFPKSGLRFHVDGCSTLKEGQVSLVLTDNLRGKYSACKLCEPDKLPNGSPVYMYSEYSDTYHRQSCSTITKSYECVSKSEAIKKGYSPCQICLKNLDANPY